MVAHLLFIYLLQKLWT